jgi:hypothetical protein
VAEIGSVHGPGKQNPAACFFLKSDRQTSGVADSYRAEQLGLQQAAEKASSRVILSEAKCRSLLEDLAVIGTKDLLAC